MPRGPLKQSVAAHAYGSMMATLAGAAFFAPAIGIGLTYEMLTEPSDWRQAASAFLVIVLLAFPTAFIAFLAGILVVGMPISWSLRRLHIGTTPVAAAVGAILTGISTYLLFRTYDWIAVALATGAAGAVAGFVYFKTTHPEFSRP